MTVGTNNRHSLASFLCVVSLLLLLTACRTHSGRSGDLGRQPVQPASQIQAKNTPAPPPQSAPPHRDNAKPATINVGDVIPVARQEIIIDLSDRLKRHPQIQAYLLSGSHLEPDGSARSLRS